MLAVPQARSALADKAANLRRLDETAAGAAAQGATLLVAPELFLTGYNLGERLHDLAEPLDGPAIASVREIATRHALAIVVGFPEAADGKLYNSAAVVDATGNTRGCYRKIQLFGETERALFTPGETPLILEIAGLTVGLAICYDIEFPEVARSLARGGANLIVAPTCNMAPYWEVPTTLIRARAIENSVCVAYANHHGTEGDLSYMGLSCIVGPDGKDLARAGVEGDALILADVAAALTAPALYTQLDDLRGELF